MTLKSYVWGIRLTTVFSLGIFGLVLNYIDPEKSGIPGKIIFYVVLFFFLSGFFNLILLWFRKKALGQDAIALNLGLSFRQGILLSAFIVGLLIMQSLRVLIWWDGLLLLAGIFIIELYFLSRNN